MRTIILMSLSLALLYGFTVKQHALTFKYPKNKSAAFTMQAQKAKFKKEWRGEDYYYFCENLQNEIVCSVLFYKLNQEEQKKYIEPIGGKGNATIALAYFTVNSATRKYEKNANFWGKATDPFMFRHMDIPEYEGTVVNQKNIFAYTMFENDLFVNVHLSKINCTAEDSILMRNFLTGLTKK